MVEFTEIFDHPEFVVTTDRSEDFDSTACFCYPGAIPNAWAPGVSLKVVSDTGLQWVGHFMTGDISPNGINLCCSHPNGTHIVVVAQGAAYVVNAADPVDWKDIDLMPILGYCFDIVERVLVLYDYTKIIGFRADGDSWVTQSLSWDGLSSVQIVDGSVVGNGWDPTTSGDAKFRVDLKTGEASGGAAPPL